MAAEVSPRRSAASLSASSSSSSSFSWSSYPLAWKSSAVFAVCFFLFLLICRWSDVFSRHYPTLVVNYVLLLMQQVHQYQQDAIGCLDELKAGTTPSAARPSGAVPLDVQAYTSATIALSTLDSVRAIMHDEDIQMLTHVDPLVLSEDVQRLQTSALTWLLTTLAKDPTPGQRDDSSSPSQPAPS
jgi:hypothetical protein